MVKTINNDNGSSLLIVLSGPSGVGKDTTLAEMKKAGIKFHHIITITTRLKRPGEINGKDYHFKTVEQFNILIEEKKLLEWSRVYNNYYGVPLNEVKKTLATGEDVIIKVDVQGVEKIKQIMPDAIAIFLSPPSQDELEMRLNSRGHDSESDMALRLKTSNEELKKMHIFDYKVANHKDNIKLTVEKIKAIILAEKCRIKPHITTIK